MNILVCLKQVPDTETKVRVKEGSTKIDEEGINWIVNPYDEFAVEEALRIKEKLGSGVITILCLGPDRATEAIRTALAMGADNAVHLNDPSLLEGDSWTVAKSLAQAITTLQLPYDLILCGKQAIDDDSVQVPSILAELLNLPQVTIVTKLEIFPEEKKAVAHRQIEGATVVVETPLPAVITCQKGLNEPRYPSLPGIMKAKKKEIKNLDLAALGLQPAEVGAAGAKVKVIEMSLPPARQAGKILEGEVSEVVPKLIKLLQEEAKVL